MEFNQTKAEWRSTRINAQLNHMGREITNLGWSKILTTYHPDINVDWDQAWEIFQIYRKIYIAKQNSCYARFTPKEQALLLNLHKINF